MLFKCCLSPRFGIDPQTIQKLLGHGDVKTTMIYLQTVPGVTLKEAKSPLDHR